MLDDVWAEEFESCHQGQMDTLVGKKYTMLRLKPNHFSEYTLNVFAMISGYVFLTSTHCENGPDNRQEIKYRWPRVLPVQDHS